MQNSNDFHTESSSHMDHPSHASGSSYANKSSCMDNLSCASNTSHAIIPSHAHNLSRRDFLRLSGSALVSAAFASAALAGLALPRHAWANPTDTNDSIVILHTNDIHCAVGDRAAEMPPIGYAAVANYLKSQRELYGNANVTLVDAGDQVQGAPMGTLSKGEYIVQIMNQTGYELACPGNHEFDYGMTQFMTNVQVASSNFSYLCCNFYDKRTNTRMLAPYAIKDYTCAGTTYKVAFIGVATPATLTSASPKSFWDNDTDRNIVYSFCEDNTGEALIEEVQTCVDEVRAAGANYVILLTHLGQTGSLNIWRSNTLAAKTSGIDIIIDGHSHEEYVQTVKNSAGNDVIITQTGTKLASLGQIIINPAAGTISASTPKYETTLLVPSGLQEETSYFEVADFEQDEETQSFIDAKQDELSKITSQVIGNSLVDLRAINDDGSWLVRTAETNAGDFVADSFLYCATNNGVKADFAFVNSGGVRANIDAGEVTYGSLITMCPFNNQLCYATYTGQVILDALEVGSRTLPKAGGGLMQVSEGFSYTVRTNIESPVILNGSTYVGIDDTKERRVRNVKLYGEALDPKKEYTVVGLSYFLIEGGSSLSMLISDDVKLICLDIEAVIEYIHVNLKDEIGEDYAESNCHGRIIQQDGPDPEPVTPNPEPVTPDPDPVTPEPSPDPVTPTPSSSSSKQSGAALPQTGDANVTGVAAALGAAGITAIALGGTQN